jgi:alpha-D-ribose 1-methylphosphonate 5-triphosphate synthase subunit PhnI
VEGSSGGTALVLVTMLLAQLKARGDIDLDQIEQALRLLLDREITVEQLTDATNALAVVQGLQGIPSA